MSKQKIKKLSYEKAVKLTANFINGFGKSFKFLLSKGDYSKFLVWNKTVYKQYYSKLIEIEVTKFETIANEDEYLVEVKKIIL